MLFGGLPRKKTWPRESCGPDRGDALVAIPFRKVIDTAIPPLAVHSTAEARMVKAKARNAAGLPVVHPHAAGVDIGAQLDLRGSRL